MKDLFVVRHAKSSWDDPNWKDYERPLNRRGKRDAPFMAAMMRVREYVADLIISSHAERAWKTAKQFRNMFILDSEYVWKDPRLYHSDPETILSVIQEIPDGFNRVYLFGHNPGITQLANQFGYNIDNVPTTGIVRFTCSFDHWVDISISNTSVSEIYYPKQFL